MARFDPITTGKTAAGNLPPTPPPGGFDDDDRELMAAGWRPRDHGSTKMWYGPHIKDYSYAKEFALSRLRRKKI
jgi:hypothetical protein